MKLKPQRMLFECINLLLAVLFVIPLGVLLEQMCKYPLYRACMIPCVSAIGFLLGRLSMKRQMGVAMAMCAAGLIVSAVVSVALSPAGLLITILLPILSGALSVFFFFSARNAGYAVYAPMAVGGILIHLFVLLCCAGFEWEDQVNTLVSIVSILFFVLTLYAFSSKGLRRSLHKGSGASRVKYPAGMQMGNFLLVTGFILIAAFISNIYPIFQVFSHLFGFVLRALLSAFAFFIGLFDRRGVVADIDEGVTQESAAESIMNAEPKGEASWVTMGVEIFAFIIVFLLLGYLIFKGFKRLQSAGLKVPKFLRDLRDRFAPTDEEDYVDETESLFDRKQFMEDASARVRSTLKKIRERPQKIDDFTDDRMKIRFAFQQLLKKVTVRTPTASAKTPNEIYEAEYAGEEDFRAFMDAYNSARYSEKEPSGADVDAAYAILKQKL